MKEVGEIEFWQKRYLKTKAECDDYKRWANMWRESYWLSCDWAKAWKQAAKKHKLKEVK